MSENTGTIAPATADNATATSDAGLPSGSATSAPVSDWMTGLHADNRKAVEAKSWKDPDAVVGSYRELERYASELKSKSLIQPPDNAKPEDMAAFYRKLGMPEKADGYQFKTPEGVPENFPYDAKNADKFKNWAHEAGLTPKQAQTLHDSFVKDTVSSYSAMQEAQAKQIADGHEALVKTWGDPTSETYKRNQELANRTLRQSGGSELLAELKGIGALGANGEVKTPQLATMLAKIGEKMFAEDALFGGPTSGPNPFSAKSENMTEQGKILRNDPDHARALIRQAGIDPKAYGL